MPAFKDYQEREMEAAARGTSESNASAAPEAVVSAVAAAGKLPPKVVSADPAMFVPLDFDITEPFEPPGSRADRALGMMQTADFYRTGVRRGMVYLAGLDRRRILATAQTAAQLGNTAENDKLEPREADILVNSMQTPFQPGTSYANSMTSYDVPLRAWQLPPELDRPGRKDTARQLQQVVELVLGQMNSYDGHICAIRARWAAELEKEQGLVAEQFGSLTTAESAVDEGAAGSTMPETLGMTEPPSEDVPITGI